MAKAIILDALEEAIGKYVLDLDPSLLKVSLFSGKIILNDLKINAAAVNKELSNSPLPLPITILNGSIGSITCEIPWTRLSSRSVKVSVKDIFLLATTTAASAPSSNQNSPTSPTSNSSQRATALATTNASRLKTRALTESEIWGDSTASTSSNKAPDSFGSRLVTRILENLDIDISNIHLRIQNPSSPSNASPCAIGVTLQHFKIFSTDANRQPSFVDREKSSNFFLYKSLSLSALALYCDPLAAAAATAELPPAAMRDLIYSEQHEYIIAPLSLALNLTQCDDTTQTTGIPQYAIQCELPSISLLLSRPQLLRTSAVFSLSPPLLSTPLFPEYRPPHPPTTHPRLWWK